MKVFIVARVIFQRRNPRPTLATQHDVLGAAEDGGVKVFIVARVIFQPAAEPTPNTTEDVLGAVEDGSVKVSIVARVIFQRRNPRPTRRRTCWAPRRTGA